jgi:hypothetical protein
MRPIVEAHATKQQLSYQYFCNAITSDAQINLSHYDIVYDNRGHFTMCHQKKEHIGCGTIDVRSYVAGMKSNEVIMDLKAFAIPYRVETVGPVNRCSAVLFVEKEGFNPIIEHAQLCERYDLALLSTKGQSSTAARYLVDRLCGGDTPLLVLHDFDVYGVSILKNLITSNHRYQFCSAVNHVDIGLGLEDIEEYSLAAESCTPPEDSALDTIAGMISADEREFLANGGRVELNAFTSEDFITWIESKLKKHGITKCVPDDDELQIAYRRAWAIRQVNGRQKNIKAKAVEAAEKMDIPPDLRAKVDAELKAEPHLPWDIAVAKVMKKEHAQDRKD